MQPFKPPSLVRRPSGTSSQPPARSEPPLKKRRLSTETGRDDPEVVSAAAKVLQQPNPSKLKSFQTPYAARKPLQNVANPAPAAPQEPPQSQSEGADSYYTVLWRKITMKKNKTWEGDGVLSVSGGYARLQDVSGRELGKSTCKGPLLPGSELSVGGKEIEIDSIIWKEDFLAGRPFLGNYKQNQPSSLNDIDGTDKVTAKAQAKHDKIAAKQKDRFVASSSQASKAGFKAPLLRNTVQQPAKDRKVPVGRHNPDAEGALVMKRPKSVPKGRQIVDVVVDPLLTRELREHQRAGVAFMYECVMGMKAYEGDGAILADEMGLGKTLQTIALLWTLLKQSPIYEDQPVIKKALIVCPVTLIQNWRKEFKKWLGSDRIGVFVVGDKKVKLTDFTMGKAYSVMIIGYEKLRMVQEDLQKGSGIDIVICDEGHRLKTAQNKAAQAIRSLNTSRRIVLSGTPLQNDLTEFYTMVDFVNPGLLGKYNTFKKEFETPILKTSQPQASKKDLEKGEARSEELANLTGMFILRRTAEILAKYLPPKTIYVVFCKPTNAQLSVYRSIVGSPTFNAALGSSAVSLELINILKKVCNSPKLLLKKADESAVPKKADESGSSTLQNVLHAIPQSLLRSPGASGKLQVLDTLLHRIRTTTQEKVVIVSNYTSTMDIIANLLNSLDYPYLRLDGTTAQNKRQELVDKFNRSSANNWFVFLLSAKAGGVGLNLIGASRMVLYDLDWNPATDDQAMARIHRDGQKRRCYIYRLVTQGALDEKIFQRQVSKAGLADSIVDGKSQVGGFTREELRDLFTLDESDDCQTHKLLACDCGGKGIPLGDIESESESPRNDLAALSASDSEVTRDENGTEVLRLDDDGDPPVAPKAKKWKSANDYDWRAEEAEVQRKAKDYRDSTGKAKMKKLMEYAHFDAALVDSYYAMDDRAAENMVDGEESDAEGSKADPLEGIIDDAALRSVLREEGRRVGFVFSKLSSG
ncbi:helicase [Saxophila tyrrhenica]|uniref:Helicase n=1 Tax=Saxophila tyrrhenica TaxID=1690608 RepID=A0AAV9NZR2_9PEZI|nr:helicase [Saxophila tyrrhenica]